MTDTIVPFLPRPRMVAVPVDTPAAEGAAPALVEHNGRAYRLAELMARMTEADLCQIEATAPRTAQATWDEVVRRWPALAGLIAAGCQASAESN